ncbi:MAG TPA: VWA domain-containing protein [Thermoanaerobaculia bacterium]|jgi:VWFA-related protein|nr:VWA domain-containing protein [Thermoanaerobaculia bacterium]
MPWRFAIALLLFAQVRETVDVAVTNVDLIVTDAKGKPVRGLIKDEFQLFEGNKPREITNFSEVSAALPVAGSVIQAPSRTVLVLFDNTTLTLGNRRRAAEAVKTWMAAQLRPVDRIAVVTAIPSLQMKQPWTFDSRAAAAAVDVVAGESTSLVEQERREAQSRIQEVIHRALTLGPNESPPRFDEMTQAVRVYAASVMRDSTAVASTIKVALGYFPRSAQKKVLLIVGEGLQTNPGSDLFHYLNSIKMDIESGAGPQVLQRGARSASPLTEANEYDLAPLLRDVTATAMRGGVLMYAINPGQNEKSGGEIMESRPSDLRAQFATSSGNRAGYDQLVRTTGGTAFYGTPPRLALAEVSEDLDSYYSIGFRTGPATDPAGALVVKSKNGYRVRATRAPAPQSSDDRMREAVLAHHVAAPMTNDLHIALATDAPVAEGDRRKVHLKVLIPVASLHLDREGEEIVGGFVVYVSSGDDHGAATKVNRQEHQIRWPAGTFDSLKGKSITFAVDVMVPTGLTQISVGVMDQRSQQTGFDRVTLGV